MIVLEGFLYIHTNINVKIGWYVVIHIRRISLLQFLDPNVQVLSLLNDQSFEVFFRGDQRRYHARQQSEEG